MALTELDVNSIEPNRVDHRAQVRIRERTLRGSSDIIPLARTRRMGPNTVHERSVSRRTSTLNVKVNTIQDGRTEGTRRA